MKDVRKKSILIVCGVIVLGVVIGVLIVKFLPGNLKSNSYFTKVNTTTYTQKIHFISHDDNGAVDNSGNPYTGDAILLESNGSFAMIDLGDVTKKRNVINYLKKVGVKKLDFILITHFDADHAGASNEEKNIINDIISNGIKISNIWLKNNGCDNCSNLEEASINRFNVIVAIANKYNIGLKYLNQAKEGKTFNDFKNLKFSMTIYNNKQNTYALMGQSENLNSIVTLINMNGHKVLLTGDMEDTKKFNEIATKVGNIDVLKVPHHGSRNCALLTKWYGKKIHNEETNKTTMLLSNALNYLKAEYYVVTSSEKKISTIRTKYNVGDNMCIDPVNAYVKNNNLTSTNSKYGVYYADSASSALVFDLTNSTISISYN